MSTHNGGAGKDINGQQTSDARIVHLRPHPPAAASKIAVHCISEISGCTMPSLQDQVRLIKGKAVFEL